MPLVPLRPPTEEIVIDGDSYTIKTMLTAFERDQTRPEQSYKIQMPYGKLENRDNIRPDDMVDVVLDTAVANLRKLKVWLVDWSHPEKLNAQSLRRLPPRHAQMLLDRIEELEEEQDGPGPDSPLVISANGSSEPAFSEDEA